MKKFWITLLSVLMLVTGLAFVTACNNADVLANYVLAEDGSLVEDDFVLPLTISGKEVQWESNNDAITVEKRTEDYLANVHLGDETANVELTVKCGSAKKSFDVTVAALDVNYFKSKYNFKQNNATVYEDFDLDTSTTIGDKTATITWSVDREQDKNYISISEDGKKCIVKESSLNPDVRINATFSYNGKTSKVPYRMTVSFERQHLEEVDYWYYNTGVSIEMSGYVLAIGTAYSESYNNVTLYMVDDDFCAGYYLYRVKPVDAETGKALKPGVHITVTGTTNTNYNGLIETNAGGTLVIDKDKPEIDVTQEVYAIDNDLIAKSPAALYNTSRMVSLDKWTVKSIEKAPSEGSTATLFTLTKGGVDVKVCVSKYLEGVYAANKDNATWTGLCGLQGTLAKDDVVSVKGILSNNNGYQIMPLEAGDVTKESVAATEVPAACTNTAKAIDAVNKIFAANGVSYKSTAGFTIFADKSFDVPTTSDGVEIKYELIRESNTVTIEAGKINVKAGIEDIASIKVTYTVKDGESVVYTTSTFHTIHSVKMSDKEIAEKVHFNLELEKTELTDTDSLPVDDNKFPGATITWSLKTAVEGVTVEGNKVINTIKEDKAIVLVATIVYGDANVTKEFEVTVKACENSVLLTSEALSIPNKYVNEGNATVDGIAFSWIGMGDYGDGMQMRTSDKTGTSSFWNAEALSNNITRLVLTWSDTKSLPTKQNVLKIEFANNAEFTDAHEETISFTDDKTLDVKVTGEYKYVRITHNNNGAVYLKSVKIVCPD